MIMQMTTVLTLSSNKVIHRSIFHSHSIASSTTLTTNVTNISFLNTFSTSPNPLSKSSLDGNSIIVMNETSVKVRSGVRLFLLAQTSNSQVWNSSWQPCVPWPWNHVCYPRPGSTHGLTLPPSFNNAAHSHYNKNLAQKACSSNWKR